MATMETASQHHQQPFPPLPASPTLTNPDMILPDERGSSSDEYEPLDNPNHGPMLMWKNAHAATSATDLSQTYYNNGRATVGGLPPPHAFGPSAPITPTTPIIYGNGTMLSDIGEVTEAESVVPGRAVSVSSRSRSNGRLAATKKGDSGSDAALRSSPTMGTAQDGPKKRPKGNLGGAGGKQQHMERRGSIESTSTITSKDQALFADFDDSVSVGDSVFQGDDEESVADSYADGATPLAREMNGGFLHHPLGSGAVREQSSASGGPGHRTEDRLSNYSTASLSRRAEQILATAKKRLTTMEDNLTRARSSLHSSSSHGSDASTPSPPMIRASPARQIQADDPPTSFSPGHARMASDGTMPQGSDPPQVYPQRSASALGAAGGYRQPINGSRSVEHLRDGFAGHYKRPHLVGDHAPLEPLGEDDALATPTGTTPSASSEQGKVKTDPTSRNPDVMIDNVGVVEERPASVAQMRDLKVQMKDLKGRISTLREQAQADRLKRRSLQSLRTPSPFTHARIDQWYAESKPTGGAAGAEQDAGRNPWNGELSTVDGESQADVGNGKPEEEAAEEGDDEEMEEVLVMNATVDRVNRVSFIRHPITQHASRAVPVAEAMVPELGDDDASIEERVEEANDGSDLETENGDVDAEEQEPEQEPFEEALATAPRITAEEAEDMSNEGFVDVIDDEEYVSESGESAYEDTLEHPISHEDREDAFDYEHFFLHSAMGTISQQRRRGSFSSEDSVETTRGPTTTMVETGDETGRPGSSASTSTFDSFATAEEGRTSRSEAQDENGAEAAPVVVLARTAAGTGTGTGTAATTSVPGKRASTEANVRRTVLGPIMGNGHALDSNASLLREVALRRPFSSAAAGSLHSVSSFESMGTTRSFPLVNKPPTQPSGEAKSEVDGADETDPERRQQQQQQQQQQQPQHRLARSMSAASFDSVKQLGGEEAPAAAAAMQALAREDQYLVERLVASLGKCVLGLTEAGRAGTESRMYRRRIDAARKMLEGLEDPWS